MIDRNWSVRGDRLKIGGLVHIVDTWTGHFVSYYCGRESQDKTRARTKEPATCIQCICRQLEFSASPRRATRSSGISSAKKAKASRTR